MPDRWLFKVFLGMGIGTVIWFVFKNFIMFALTLGLMYFQAATWNGGKGQPTKSIELKIPETQTTLVVFAKRSHPSQPEFDRWMEVRTAGKPPHKVELVGDTSGANIIDVFVQRDADNLKVYLTSPFFYRGHHRVDPGAHGSYPDVLDIPSAAAVERAKEFAHANPDAQIDPIKMATEFSQQKFWILYKGSFERTRTEDSSHLDKLTKIGSFDTRYNTWTDSVTSDSL